jgi:hypothetical protein
MTTTENQTHTALVTCSCKACRKYATAKGLPFPMQALAQPAAAERVDARSLVHAAYDSVLVYALGNDAPSIPANG